MMPSNKSNGAVVERWNQFIKAIEVCDAPLWGIVASARPVSWDTRGLKLAFRTDAEASLARMASAKLQKVTGTPGVEVVVIPPGSHNDVAFIRGKNGAGMSKIERYGWTCEIPPGEQAEVSPAEIHFDHSYQRERNEDKIMEMARAFNWGAFGVVVLNRRPDGTLWGVDGMHRVLATLRRADIVKIPALIVTVPIEDEPRLFLALNTLRKAVNGLDKFRAEVKSQLPAAVLVNNLITASGLQVAKSIGNSTGKGGVRCISTLKRWANNHPDVLARVWPVIKSMSDNSPSSSGTGIGITDWVVDSLCFIEWRLGKQKKTLTLQPWKGRVIALGLGGVTDAAKKAAAYYAKGGARVWADGVVTALNHGMRHRLSLYPSSETEDAGA